MNSPLPTHDLSPEQLAVACSNALDKDDHASHALGIQIIETIPGKAMLQMQVRKDMLNGHGICHGGMVFTLCDTAFAHACNNTNHNTVAAACQIDYLAASHEHDVLTATAEERSRSGRTGVYDIEVRNQNQVLIALFRGKSHQIKGHLVSVGGEYDQFS